MNAPPSGKQPVTPRRLALWGLSLVIASAVLTVFVTSIGDAYGEDLSDDVVPFARLLLIPGLLLILGACIAKVIQIGVRSANDD